MAAHYRYVKSSIAKRRQWVDSLKAFPCTRCKVSYPPYVMEWHHRDRATKKFIIGGGSFRYSRRSISEEIGKCDLLCSNCHRIVEYELGLDSRKGVLRISEPVSREAHNL